MKKAVVSLSGGVDSTVVLCNAISQGRDCLAVMFLYGAKHNTHENAAASSVAAHYKVPFRVVDLSKVMEGFTSDLLRSGGEVPEGHYEEESMRRTVVPARNIIFAAVLAGVAWSEKADEVWLGIHAGDHYIYPDCRPGFFFAMQRAVDEGTDWKVRLRAPFLHRDKVAIVTEGLVMQVPFHLTRTCYQDRGIACGRCGSCQERLAAFAANHVEDPLPYESRDLIAKS